KQLKINSSYGIYIGENGVVANSPAEKSGLKANDTILEADGTKLDKIGLKDYIKNKFPGDIIKLKVLRDGKTIDVDLVLGDI
ncbi:MAG: PDZ domain-containing protein, partial [Candidatus Gracilibacteria bacterium]|nr:PDZ domain-containing protein [Candidatus Gracilibacteria bacterium]